MSLMIPITMTLKASARNAGDVARVQQIAAELGMAPSSAGRASLSFRVPEEEFERLFDTTPQPLPARPPELADYGTPGGFEEAVLRIPESLTPYVDIISVMPPATRLYRSLDTGF